VTVCLGHDRGPQHLGTHKILRHSTVLLVAGDFNAGGAIATRLSRSPWKLVAAVGV
jgi:hypothetical protein